MCNKALALRRCIISVLIIFGTDYEKFCKNEQYLYFN